MSNDPTIPASLSDLFSDACGAHLLRAPESYFFVSVQLVITQRGRAVRFISIPSWFEGPIWVTSLPVPEDIPMEYIYGTEDQRQATLQSYEYFSNWIGSWPGTLSSTPLLAIKLDPQCLWFIRFPVTSYIHLGLGIFGKCAGAQWIVTDRSFCTTVSNRTGLAAGLSSVETLLEGTVIILNVYRRHLTGTAGTQVKEAVRVLKELLVGLQNVPVGERILSLRILTDPSAEEIAETLTKDSTRFVFAAFEAGRGIWELSHSDYDEHSEPQFLDLSSLCNCLLHVQLMRIFHCNSVFRPSTDSDPATAHTLARQLLETGAQFVEGGVTEESYFDFVFAILQMLFKTNLRVVLEARGLEGSLDLQGLTDRCTQLLRARGYDPALAGL